MGIITLGLSDIQIGNVDVTGDMPAAMAKIAKTYKDTCKLSQAVSEVAEHYEEGKASPEARNKQKKMPILAFSVMDPDADIMANYIGGTNTNGKWGMNGDEVVANKAVRVVPKKGLTIDIPNADIEAVINADMSAKGILLVDFTVTPMAVPAGKKAIMAYPSSTLEVTPTSLSFTSAADATGKTITATSTGNVTYAAADPGADWITVTRALKVVTVKVTANANSEARTANVTIVADGKTVVVQVTQAGV